MLARHFKSIDALSTATIDELQQVEGVGEMIAKSVIAYFQNPVNREIVSRLRNYGVQMQLAEGQQTHSSRLAGLNIVISGVFVHHSRDEYKEMIELHGGKNVSSISNKTSFVLAGANMGPSKLEKAQQLGVEVLGEDDFLKRYFADNQQDDSATDRRESYVEGSLF